MLIKRTFSYKNNYHKMLDYSDISVIVNRWKGVLLKMREVVQMARRIQNAFIDIIVSVLFAGTGLRKVRR